RGVPHYPGAARAAAVPVARAAHRLGRRSARRPWAAACYIQPPLKQGYLDLLRGAGGEMKINRPKDFWSRGMFMTFGLFFMFWAIGTPKWFNELVPALVVPGYQMGTAVRMGPAYFPTMLGGLLAVLGGIILAQSMTLKGDDDAALKLPFNIVDIG